MSGRAHPDRRIERLNFVIEHGHGLYLNGNNLTVLRRQVLAATRTGDGPIPELTLLAEDQRHRQRHPAPLDLKEGGSVVYAWPTNDLEDGDYELTSTIRLRSARTGILRNLIGTVRVRVEHGCLVALHLNQPDPDEPRGLSQSAGTAERVIALSAREQARQNSRKARLARVAAHEGRTNAPGADR